MTKKKHEHLTKRPKGKEFDLPYFLRNQGDGSAVVVNCLTLEEAEKRCDEQDEGWGENSGNLQTVILTPEGKLYYEVDLEIDKENYKYETVWVEMKVA